MNESVVFADSVETNTLSANTESLRMLVRKLICEVNGEVLKDMLVDVSSPVHRTESYRVIEKDGRDFKPL